MEEFKLITGEDGSQAIVQASGGIDIGVQFDGEAVASEDQVALKPTEFDTAAKRLATHTVSFDTMKKKLRFKAMPKKTRPTTQQHDGTETGV